MNTLIRLATAQDCGQIGAIYAPYVRNTAISFETEPPSADEMRARLAKILEFMPWLICERDEQIIGYAYADKYRMRAAYQWSASVSVYVDSSAHRGGVGRGLYTSLLGILESQGLYNVFAGITLPDVGGSVGFHRSFGFRQIGLEQAVGYKLGAWHDVSLWHLLLRPCEPNPRPPVPIADAVKMDSWRALISAGLPLVRE
ncbi:MAG: N-acetyltransferase family protein [Candidatus Binataceae bacterium]